MTGATTKVQGKRKTKVGRVVSDKMDKTIVVSILSLTTRPTFVFRWPCTGAFAPVIA